MVLAAVFSLHLHSPTTFGTTPEITVRSVIDGINQKNPDTLISAYEIVGPKAKESLAKVFAEMKDKMPTYVVSNFSVTETGDTAIAKVKLSMTGQNSFSPPDETVNLVKIAGDWKISNKEVSKSGGQGLYGGLGAFLKNPQVDVQQARTAAVATSILSSMKQMALACLMFSADYDDKYPLSSANMKQKLMPYLKNDAVFNGPDGKPLPVMFNPNLTGKKQSDIRRPAETVLLSLGNKGALVFKDDRTPIAFADGHVKYLSRAETAKLVWLP